MPRSDLQIGLVTPGAGQVSSELSPAGKFPSSRTPGRGLCPVCPELSRSAVPCRAGRATAARLKTLSSQWPGHRRVASPAGARAPGEAQ
eukprot:438454-Hanusia_phi.AAC.3